MKKIDKHCVFDVYTIFTKKIKSSSICLLIEWFTLDKGKKKSNHVYGKWWCWRRQRWWRKQRNRNPDGGVTTPPGKRTTPRDSILRQQSSSLAYVLCLLEYCLSVSFIYFIFNLMCKCITLVFAVEAVVLGFQHYMLSLGITVLIPSLLVPLMGGGDVSI